MSIAGIAEAVIAPLIENLVAYGHDADRVARRLERAELAERFSRAAWSVIAEPGDRIAGVLIDTLGAEQALTTVLEGATPDATLGRLRDHDPLGGGSAEARSQLAEALARWAPRVNAGAVLRMLEQSRRTGVGLLVPGDPEWPTGLSDLGPHAPLALWFQGQRNTVSALGRSVAIVGARAATGYGEHVAVELAGGLSDRGYCVVSGAAYGIDAAAHRAALGSRGTTVAVLAGGLDRYYPSGHEELIRRIAQSGAVIAEVPCGTAPTKWRFLQRNRLIAAAAGATIVVEAGFRSGSLNTASHATAIGRPVGAVPGPVTSPASAGCHRLLREGPAVLVTSVQDAAELVPAIEDDVNVIPGLELGEPSRAASAARGRPALDGAPLRVLDALSTRSPRDAEVLARVSGLAVDRVRAELGVLELDGAVRRHPDGWTRRARAASPRT